MAEIGVVEVEVEVQWEQHYKESSATRYLRIMMRYIYNGIVTG